jgi:hypothetical protein
MKQLIPFILVCLAACDGGTVRQRTGDADVSLTPALVDCAVDKEMAEVVDFLNTPSGTEEEDMQMSKVLKAISKSCTDDAIINTDAVELRYELRKKVN